MPDLTKLRQKLMAVEHLKKCKIVTKVADAEDYKLFVTVSLHRLASASGQLGSQAMEPESALDFLREMLPTACAFAMTRDHGAARTIGVQLRFVIEPTNDVLEALDAMDAAAKALR